MLSVTHKADKKNGSENILNLIKLGSKDELPKGTANFLNTVLGNVYENT